MVAYFIANFTRLCKLCGNYEKEGRYFSWACVEECSTGKCMERSVSHTLHKVLNTIFSLKICNTIVVTTHGEPNHPSLLDKHSFVTFNKDINKLKCSSLQNLIKLLIKKFPPLSLNKMSIVDQFTFYLI